MSSTDWPIPEELRPAPVQASDSGEVLNRTELDNRKQQDCAHPTTNDSSPTLAARRTVQRLAGRWKQMDGTNRLKNLGTQLQKVNLAKIIDKMEQDQELANELENVNEETEREVERRLVVQESMNACLQAIREHLQDFIKENPQGTYEQWIEQVHPENAQAGQLLEGLSRTVDHRFYIEESDHRQLWNEYADTSNRRHVPARSQHGGVQCKSLDDLLATTTDQDDSEDESDSDDSSSTEDSSDDDKTEDLILGNVANSIDDLFASNDEPPLSATDNADGDDKGKDLISFD